MEQFLNKIIQGDTLEVLKTLPDECVDCIITSPPYYGLRDYGVEGQLGLEPTLGEYLEKMLLITAELKRVLKKTGTMWWNHGDSYANRNPDRKGGAQPAQGKNRKGTANRIYSTEFPEKSLMLQDHRLAIRMIDQQGWILRNTIIWHKPNCMPSSVKDRFTVDYEPIFFFTKSKRYCFEPQYEPMLTKDTSSPRGSKGVIGQKNAGRRKQDLVGRNDHTGFNDRYVPPPFGRNKRSVWTIPPKPFPEAHFATFPEKLIETPILAGCPEGGVVLDCFMGAGTTGLVAKKLGRNYIGIELNPAYIEIAKRRLAQDVLSINYASSPQNYAHYQ